MLEVKHIRIPEAFADSIKKLSSESVYKHSSSTGQQYSYGRLSKFMTYHVIHKVESNHKVNEKEHWACRIFKVWFQCDIWVAACK